MATRFEMVWPNNYISAAMGASHLCLCNVKMKGCSLSHEWPSTNGAWEPGIDFSLFVPLSKPFWLFRISWHDWTSVILSSNQLNSESPALCHFPHFCSLLSTIHSPINHPSIYSSPILQSHSRHHHLFLTVLPACCPCHSHHTLYLSPHLGWLFFKWYDLI